MLTETRQCRDCGQSFDAVFYRGGFAARCPRCQDVYQRRPTVALSRNVLFRSPARIVRLPKDGRWEYFRVKAKDNPAFRIVFKGADLDPASAAPWAGRIDIFAPVGWSYGKVVLFEEVEARHAVSADKVETRRYVRLSKLPPIEQYEMDGEPSDLVWEVFEAPPPDGDLWQRSISNGALWGALRLAPGLYDAFVQQARQAREDRSF